MCIPIFFLRNRPQDSLRPFPVPRKGLGHALLSRTMRKHRFRRICPAERRHHSFILNKTRTHTSRDVAAASTSRANSRKRGHREGVGGREGRRKGERQRIEGEGNRGGRKDQRRWVFQTSSPDQYHVPERRFHVTPTDAWARESIFHYPTCYERQRSVGEGMHVIAQSRSSGSTDHMREARDSWRIAKTNHEQDELAAALFIHRFIH